MHLTLWYSVLVCDQNYVCNNYIACVYVGRVGGLSESGICVHPKFCPVGFRVVSNCSSVLLQFLVIQVSYG